MQKKSIRIINNSKYNSHTDPLFRKNKILKVDDLIYLRILIFNHKLLNQKIPSYFNSFTIERQSQVHNHLTRSNIKPAPLRSSANYQSNTLRFQLNKTVIMAPLSYTTNITASEQSFKFKLKKEIIEKYSSVCTVNNCYVCLNNQ